MNFAAFVRLMRGRSGEGGTGEAQGAKKAERAKETKGAKKAKGAKKGAKEAEGGGSCLDVHSAAVPSLRYSLKGRGTLGIGEWMRMFGCFALVDRCLGPSFTQTVYVLRERRERGEKSQIVYLEIRGGYCICSYVLPSQHTYTYTYTCDSALTLLMYLST